MLMQRLMALVAAAAVLLPVYAQQKFNSDVENVGAGCVVALPGSFTTANSKLPDPFLKLDKTRIAGKGDWWCRRQEILKLAERTVYGEKPPKPATVTGTVSRTSISVSVAEGGKTGTFSVTVSMPSTGSAPYPAVIRYGNSGADAGVITGQGVAVINYTPTTVGAESGGNRNNKSGVFYTVYGTNHKAGTLVAWAWGVSRIIDVIEADPNKLLDPTAIGVTGCSRYGKGPLAAGAFDQRIALTMPMESGTGGTNIMRGAYADRDQSGGSNGAQSPSSAYNEQPWLGDDFSAFMNNPNNLPIDMHEVVAMIAPRGFLVLDKTAASAGQWLNIPSSHASVLAGAEVYKALGVGGNLQYINTPTVSHCTWDATVYNSRVQDFIQKFLLRTKPADGTDPLFTATAPPNMSNWIDWTTPPLSGELGVGGGTVSGFSLASTSSPAMGGTVSRNPAPPAGGRYEEGATVTVTAAATDGWKFDGWGGDAVGAEASITVTMDRNINVVAKFVPTADGTDNLIKNGNFANTQNWTLNKWQNSDAAFAVSGGNGNITGITVPSGTDAAAHSLQLVQNAIPLTAGMKYRLTFDASAASAREISVYMQMDGTPYTSYLSKDVGLTAEKASFTYEFEMAATDDNARIAFNFGGASPNVSLSNVKLIYIAGGTAPVHGDRNVSSVNKQSSALRVSAASSGLINISFRASGSGVTMIRLYDLKGKLILSEKLQTISGTNYSHTIKSGGLPNGVYVVGVRNNGKAEQARVAVPK
ncbi:MAG: carbohydrate binding domain-containing protein [Chitinispirillia bacterium]|nr:carbohydrate binding domain-containing protein [Chitinispirillia bacterium]MCL2242577.1 carbohydrate binding domain-containing protein [Chitinispirillia bacterium]